MLQGIIKPALQRLRDAYCARARELGEEMLSMQEKRDSGRELLAERNEENRAAEAQVGWLRSLCPGSAWASGSGNVQVLVSACSSPRVVGSGVFGCTSVCGLGIQQWEHLCGVWMAQVECLPSSVAGSQGG